MKHNFPFLILLVIVLAGLNIYQYLNPREILIENKPSLKENNNLISMLVEQENGEYQELKDTNWPGSEYVLNESLSGCENGGKISYINKEIKVQATSSDRCYVYFAFKKPYHETCQDDSATCKLVKTTLTDENLIYHKTNYLNKIELVNKELSANDESYRYSGANPDNYVCLDGTTVEGNCATESDLYRIIGLFKNDQDQYEMKLIKYDYATKDELGDNINAPGGAYMGNYGGTKENYQGNNAANIAAYRWNSTKGPSLEDGNTNMWRQSNLNKINLNQFYYNYITSKVSNLSKHITEHKWSIGGFPYSSIYTPKQLYDRELGTEKLKVDAQNCYDENDNSTARKCTDVDLTYSDEIGLMYVSDYGFAAYPEAWNTKTGNGGYSLDDIKTNNWMFMGLVEWAISRNSVNGGYSGYIYILGFVDTTYVYNTQGVRPTFYLDSSTKIASGEGSYDKPYRLLLN